MQLSITNKLSIIIAALLLAFGAAFTAYAYDGLEIEVDVRDASTRVEVEHGEGEDRVTEVYEYETTNLDEVYTMLAEELDLTFAEVDEVATEVSDEDEDEDEEEDEEKDNDDEHEDMNDEEEAAEAIEDAEDAIAEAEEYVDSLYVGVTIGPIVICDVIEGTEPGPECTSNEDQEENAELDKINELKEVLAEAEELLEDAVTAFDNGDFEESEDKAEAAEDRAEEILDDEDEYEDEEEEDDDDKSVCDSSQGRGYGVMTKCVDEDIKDYKKDKDFRSDYRSEWKEYGKTTDRDELQSQIRELLLVLIELLQAQMALQDA